MIYETRVNDVLDFLVFSLMKKYKILVNKKLIMFVALQWYIVVAPL